MERIVSKISSLPKQMPSSSARKMWPRPWRRVSPVSAPRLAASVKGVRLPCAGRAGGWGPARGQVGTRVDRM